MIKDDTIINDGIVISNMIIIMDYNIYANWQNIYNNIQYNLYGRIIQIIK